MYWELFAASYLIFRWNYIETDIANGKHIVTHFVVPLLQSSFHHLKDSCCSSRKPQPGMRPPSLQRPTATTATSSVETNAKTD
jgi:hypothetical protein